MCRQPETYWFPLLIKASVVVPFMQLILIEEIVAGSPQMTVTLIFPTEEVNRLHVKSRKTSSEL